MNETIGNGNMMVQKGIPVGQRVFLYSGMVFLGSSLILFAADAYMMYRFFNAYAQIAFEVGRSQQGPAIYAMLGAAFLPLVIIGIFGGIAVFVGLRLLHAAGAVSSQVIPPGEFELLAPAVRDGNEEAINQYIRLSSLSGATGTFTKVGLTGLPLATIVLTIVLATLGVFFPQSQLFDLAQLTLGAFLGSYVQKRSDIGENQIALPPRN